MRVRGASPCSPAFLVTGRMLTHLRPGGRPPCRRGSGPTWSPTSAGSRLRDDRLASASTAPPARIRRHPCPDRPPSAKAERCVTAVRRLLLPRRSSGPLAWGARHPGSRPDDRCPRAPNPRPSHRRGCWGRWAQPGRLSRALRLSDCRSGPCAGRSSLAMAPRPGVRRPGSCSHDHAPASQTQACTIGAGLGFRGPAWLSTVRAQGCLAAGPRPRWPLRLHGANGASSLGVPS